jgi:hypothetical protein
LYLTIVCFCFVNADLNAAGEWLCSTIFANVVLAHIFSEMPGKKLVGVRAKNSRKKTPARNQTHSAGERWVYIGSRQYTYLYDKLNKAMM